MECLFYQGLPELHVMNYTFEKYIQHYCQKLYLHLRNVDMKTEYFTFKWNLTLYSCSLPIEILVHIFDLFVYDGWPAIYRVGISLLNNKMKKKLLAMDSMMDVSQYFRDDVRKISTYSIKDIHTVISESSMINITQADLAKYKEDYFVDLAKQKMSEHKFERLDKLNLDRDQI